MRSLLTVAERGQILAMPTGPEDLEVHYTSSNGVVSLIRQRCRDANRLGLDENAADPELLRFLPPLGWEHIKLTGDYTWPRANQFKPCKYRPLRRPARR